LLHVAGLLTISLSALSVTTVHSVFPVAVSTYNFRIATDTMWESLSSGGSAVEAIVAGGTICEEQQCGLSVGYGAKPDEQGETTLDAMVMDGLTMDAGAVGCMRNVKNVIGVAYAIMKYTIHTFLVGSLATDFAISMGFQTSSLSTNQSITQWEDWKARNCQPNFRENVTPDPRQNCGPYTPIDGQQSKGASNSEIIKQIMKPTGQKSQRKRSLGTVMKEELDHDTIGLVSVDADGNVAGGTTTNGLAHKIPGRVGDSPLVGSGAYADNSAGAAAATGNGDIMLRFLPSFMTVEAMRSGATPAAAASLALARIAQHYPGTNFYGAIIAVNNDGEYGAACRNLANGFQYTVMSPDFTETQLEMITCTTS